MNTNLRKSIKRDEIILLGNINTQKKHRLIFRFQKYRIVKVKKFVKC